MSEMYPRAPPEAQPAPRGLIERARLLTITGERPVEPFNFSASVRQPSTIDMMASL